MDAARGRAEELVFETPDPPPQRAAGAPSRAAAAPDGLDTSSAPAKQALEKFSAREAAAAASSTGGASCSSRHARQYETLGPQAGPGFEPPEQRLARLQAEVADFLNFTERSVSKDSVAAHELLGADPNVVSEELKVLEKRLAALARDGPAAWQSGEALAAGANMAGPLVSQLERLATGQASSAGYGGGEPSGPGQVTYEICYTPGTAAIADSAKMAALESSIADIERQLGVVEPSCPFPDLQSAVTQLQKRVGLLDSQKLDSMSKGVDKVLREIEKVLAKKAELDGGADKELDQKVNQLYDFCHRWNASAASLPSIVARLQTLQALHLQSCSFAKRLASLEQQQEELVKLLGTTMDAVQDLGKGLQENMGVMRDNMKSLEEKIVKVVK
eukprot:TRINITY_DN98383_c0_g1_i1.p1 TRINITY_DN98383_c0_g1~~TRINITY_DN98383_c0_g1_i1.p1  ORF type:complete len:409 (-),score=119.09 TRINITY_DN98383_c0_g1_i1:73-1239(-)